MCIIVSKEKNKMIPTKEILQNCFNNNSDGAGFMYVTNGAVQIEKGFMNFESFYNRIMELDKKINLVKRSLVMHFRIGTSGKNDGATCHPFPISNNFEELRAEKIKSKIGMVHNGIIPSYAYDKVLSDTQNYVKDFVFNLYKIDKHFLQNKYTRPVINASCNNTKLAFLTASDKIYYYGDFIKDENGIKYSNGTYKYSYTKIWTRPSYSKYYDYFDDCYYDDDIKGDKKELGDDIEDYDESLIFYERPENLAILSKNYYYYGDDVKFNEIGFEKCNGNMCIDEFYNLYEILDDGDELYKVKLIDTNVYILDNAFQDIDFEKIQNKNK